MARCKSSRLAISCLLSAVQFILAGVTPCNWLLRIPRSAPSCAFLAHALVCCFCYGLFLALEVSPDHRHRFASLLFVPQRFFYHAVAMIAWLRSCAAELHPVSLPRSLPSDWACPVGTVQGLSPCLSPARCRPRTSLFSGRVSFLSALSATWVHSLHTRWFCFRTLSLARTSSLSVPQPLPLLLLLALPLPLPLGNYHYRYLFHYHSFPLPLPLSFTGASLELGPPNQFQWYKLLASFFGFQFL